MTIPVPTYGSSFTDTSGNTGVAKFDPNTGKALSTDGASTSTFLQTLQDRLMGMSSMISSDSTTLESSIQSAIGGVQTSTAKGSLAIESAGNREIQAEKDKLAATRAASEGGTGFAFNSAALAQLDASTDKSLKDMEQRKQELILQNDATGAGKIADLQLKAEEFRQKARQDMFSNILNMGQLGLQKQAQETATQQFGQTFKLQQMQFDYTRDAQISQIATQYGVSVSPGETLQTITNKVKQFASAEQKARLSKLVEDGRKESTQINATNTLYEAITGTGSFEKLGALSAVDAVDAAARDMKNYGLTPTRAELNSMIEQAKKMETEYKLTLDKTKAETVGNSFWGNFANFFGGAATGQAQASLSAPNKQYQSLQPRDKGTFEMPSFFNLFNQ